MKKRLVLVLIFILSGMVVLQASYFETTRYISPRGESLANAIIADSEDPINGFLYNPGLIPYSRSLLVQPMIFSMNHLAAIDTANFKTFYGSLIIPLATAVKFEPVFKDLVFAFALNSFTMNDTVSDQLESDDMKFQTMLMSFGLGKKIENLFGYGSVVSVGVNINLFNIRLPQNGAAMNNPDLNSSKYDYKKWTMGLDFGITYKLSDALLLALVLENLIRPAEGFITPDKAKSSQKFGLSWKFANLSFMQSPTLFFTYQMRAATGKGNQPDKEFHLGYEFWQLNKILALRLGYEMSTLSDKEKGSVIGFNYLTYGLGFNIPAGYGHEFQVDMSGKSPFVFGGDNRLREPLGALQFALTYKWKWPQSWFEFDEEKRNERRALEELEGRYREEEKETEESEGELARDIKTTGSVNLANLEGADKIVGQANKDRNETILGLYNNYISQRDDNINKADNLKSDAASQLNPLDTDINGLKDKLEQASDDADKELIANEMNEKNAEKKQIAENVNSQIVVFNTEINSMKKSAINDLKDIGKNYDKIKKKNQKELTDNFIEMDPPVPMQEWQTELESSDNLIPLIEADTETIKVKPSKTKAEPKIEKSEVDPEVDPIPELDSTEDTTESSEVAEDGNAEAQAALEQAATDRNNAIETLYNDFQSKKQELEDRKTTLQEDGTGKTEQVNTMIADLEQQKLDAGEDADLIKDLDSQISGLQKQISESAKQLEKDVASVDKELATLKKNSAKALSTIEKNYDKNASKLLKEAPGFAPEAPSIPLEEFKGELVG